MMRPPSWHHIDRHQLADFRASLMPIARNLVMLGLLRAAIPPIIANRGVRLADHDVAEVAARQIDDNQASRFGDRVRCEVVGWCWLLIFLALSSVLLNSLHRADLRRSEAGSINP